MKLTYKKRRSNKKIKKSRKAKNINYRGGDSRAIETINEILDKSKNNGHLNDNDINVLQNNIKILQEFLNKNPQQSEEVKNNINKLINEVNTKINSTINKTIFKNLPGNEVVDELNRDRPSQLTKTERQNRYNELLKNPENIENIKKEESENIKEIVVYNNNTENININYLLDFIKKIQKIDLTKFLIKENLLSGLNKFNNTLTNIYKSSNIPDKIKPNINNLIIATNNLKESIDEDTTKTMIKGNEMVVYDDNIFKKMNEINTILNNTITEIEPFIKNKDNNNITTGYDTVQFNLTLKNPKSVFDEKNKTLTYNITSETQKGGHRKKHTIRRNKNHKSKHSKKRI